MSRGPDRATLLLSIDVGGASRTCAEALRWLAGTLEDYAIPGTWALRHDDWQFVMPLIGLRPSADGMDAAGGAGPGCAPVSCEVAPNDASAFCHALALSMDASHAEASRSRLTTELAAQLQAANAAACRPEAILLQGRGIPSHLDVLARQGIRALGVWDGSCPRPRSMWERLGAWWGDPPEPNRPARLLRHGVWEVPAALAIPGTSWRAATTTLEHCLRRGTLLHVAVCASAMGTAGARAELTQLLACLALRHEQGALAVDTLPGYIAWLMAPRTKQPARSILRPQAA
ncbi:MAG: hypothetical protein K6T86_00015 [Pirellulales bacterium]|nr:hypothetical protein [Pirellulales bacterium]